jgi:hypothetical protein
MSNTEKSARMQLAEMCVYSDREFVHTSILNMGTSVFAEVNGSYNDYKLYEVPSGANLDFYPMSTNGSFDRPIPMSGFEFIEAVQDHSVMLANGYMVSTIDISKELREVKADEQRLKSKDPMQWESLRNKWQNVDQKQVEKIINQHFKDPTVENRLARKCIDSGREPYILSKNDIIVINPGSRKAKCVIASELKEKDLKRGTQLAVHKSENVDISLGVVLSAKISGENMMIETMTPYSMDESIFAPALGYIASTTDYLAEYNRELAEDRKHSTQLADISQLGYDYDSRSW